MILMWCIGVLLCILSIWLLKNLRKRDVYFKSGYKPILRVWHVIVISILGLIPAIGLVFGMSLLLFTGLSCTFDEFIWNPTKKSGRVISFLSKTIE